MKIIWMFRTLTMFAVLTAILLGLGMIVSALTIGNWIPGLMIMAVVTVVFTFASFFWSKNLAIKTSGARIITEMENPRLYSIVRDVAGRAGVPMPEVGISPTMAPNAFATGRNPKNAAVVCTEGILQLLPDDELRGVIAHEMSHIKNRDVLIMSITSALALLVSYVARMMWWMVIFTPSGGKDDNNRLILIAVALAAQILVPFAALLIQLGISRNREYLADETGAMIIRDPRALARALDHLEKGNDYIQAKFAEERSREAAKKDKYNPANDYDYAHMYIANPLKKGSFLAGLFSTHPPMEERIARLNKLADKMGL